MQIAQT